MGLDDRPPPHFHPPALNARSSLVPVSMVCLRPHLGAPPRLLPLVTCLTGVAAAVAMATTTGCGPEFAPSYLVQEARVIAIVADPPEATIGEEVRLTPLVVSSAGTLSAEEADYSPTWWRCPDEEADALQDAITCEVPSDRENLSDAVPYVDTVPTDLFPIPAAGEELSDDARARLLGVALGYWRVLGLEVEASPTRRVQAIKRVVVYAPVPLGLIDERLAPLDTRVDADGQLVRNENPSLTGVEVREGTETGASVSTLKAGGTYFFRPRYDERSIAPYASLRADLVGLPLDNPSIIANLTAAEIERRFERVNRCEIPLFSWYVTAGVLRQETTVDETVVNGTYAERGVSCPAIEGEPRSPAVRYIPPEGDDVPADGIVHAWVVMRDGRGGTSVREFEFTVEP